MPGLPTGRNLLHRTIHLGTDKLLRLSTRTGRTLHKRAAATRLACARRYTAARRATSPAGIRSGFAPETCTTSTRRESVLGLTPIRFAATFKEG